MSETDNVPSGMPSALAALTDARCEELATRMTLRSSEKHREGKAMIERIVAMLFRLAQSCVDGER